MRKRKNQSKSICRKNSISATESRPVDSNKYKMKTFWKGLKSLKGIVAAATAVALLISTIFGLALVVLQSRSTPKRSDNHKQLSRDAKLIVEVKPQPIPPSSEKNEASVEDKARHSIRMTANPNVNRAATICPELRHCGLVTTLDTNAEIDLEKLKQFLDSNIQKLLEPASISQDTSRANVVRESITFTHDFVSCRIPLKFSLNFGEYDSYHVPSKLSMNVLLAVSREGVVQIGTESEYPQEHLLVFANREGMNNFRDFNRYPLNSKKLKGDSPENSYVAIGPKQSLLAYWLERFYIKIHNAQRGIVANGPSNCHELYGRDVQLLNNFEKEIVVYRGELFHFQYDEDEFNIQRKVWEATTPEILQILMRIHHSMSSPQGSETDRRLFLEHKIKFKIGRNGIGPCLFFVQVSQDDDASSGIRNASQFHAVVENTKDNGFDAQYITKSFESPPNNTTDYIFGRIAGKEERGSIIELEQRKGVVQGASRKVSCSCMLAYNQFPRKLIFKAVSEYSLVKNRYTLVAFGDIDFEAPISTAVQLDKYGKKFGKIRSRRIKPLDATFAVNPEARTKQFAN